MRDALDTHSLESASSTRFENRSGQNPSRFFKWNSTSEFLIISIGAHATLMSFENFNNPNTTEVANVIQIIVMYVVIGVPITYMQVLLGQYTHLGFFFLKRMLPLGEGLSYASCLSIICGSVYKVLVMETFFLYLMISMEPSQLQWTYCLSDFAHMCWEPENICGNNKKCVSDKVYLAAYVYWNYTFMEGTSPPEQSRIDAPDVSRVWASFLCWLLIYVISVVEFVKLKKVCKVIILFVVILKIILTFLLIIMEGIATTMTQIFSLEPMCFFSSKAWKNAIQRVLVSLTIGDLSYMMFGVFSHETSHTGTVMCFNGMISFAIEILDMFLIGSSTISLLPRANIKYSERYLLFQPRTAEMGVGVVPAALGLKAGSRIWTLTYFLICCFNVLLRVVVTIVLLQQALYQRFERLFAYYKYISPVFCVVGFGLGCLFESKEAYELMLDTRHFIEKFCDHVNILILCVFVFYVYGVRTLSDDIHFMTGSSPTMFWKITWILSPIILMWSLPIEFLSTSHPLYSKRYILLAIMLCPYLIMTTIQVIKKVVERNIISLFRPHPTWGPPDPKKLDSRKTFNPRQETRYKKKVYSCQHKCLIGNKFLGKTLREEDKYNAGEISVL